MERGQITRAVEVVLDPSPPERRLRSYGHPRRRHLEHLRRPLRSGRRRRADAAPE